VKILCVLSRYAYGKPQRGENYDYVHFVPAFERMGHEVAFFDTGDRSRYVDFADLNIALLAHVADFRPDVIFCVLMHYEIWFETLELIRSKSPVLIVNWGTDDSWKFAQASRFFAEHVDLHVTTDLAAVEKARCLGLSNVFLSQWAGSGATLAEPSPSLSCRYDVSFVGSMYGYRAEWIAALRRNGIAVSCFGHGTENGVVDASEIPRIFRTSRISLNFSGSGQNATGAGRTGGRQIKARTFEVPCAGGFLLTETTPGLERYYVVDREVATFDSPDELVVKVRHFLDQPEVRDGIARAGHEKTATEHTYEKRFAKILLRLSSIDPGRATRPWALSPDALADAVRRHRSRGSIGWLRTSLLAAFTAVFGKQRGPRAARRLAYECSWRLVGEATYQASGLPGRLFYAES
jgi:spore maturation protein CgeB